MNIDDTVVICKCVLVFIWWTNHSGAGRKWIWIIWQWYAVQDAYCWGFLLVLFTHN